LAGKFATRDPLHHQIDAFRIDGRAGDRTAAPTAGPARRLNLDELSRIKGEWMRQNQLESPQRFGQFFNSGNLGGLVSRREDRGIVPIGNVLIANSQIRQRAGLT